MAATADRLGPKNLHYSSESIQVVHGRPGNATTGLPMGADASDLSLVRRVQRGERGAYDLLVLKYQHKVVKLVMRYLRNPAKNALAARDRNPVSYELDLQNQDDSSDMISRLKDPETPEGLALTEEIRDTVNHAIEELPEDLRTAIVLRELEGMSYEEIAASMDCPVGTVRSRIFRAREAIDRRLREVFDGGLGRTEELV